MGQTTQVHHERDARSLHVICDASLQKQVHPHILGMYLNQPERMTTNRPPRVRWSDERGSMHTARDACTQSPDSLIWAFLCQPLSNLSKDISAPPQMGTGVTHTHTELTCRMDRHLPVHIPERDQHRNVPPKHGWTAIPHTGSDGRPAIFIQVYRPPHCGMVPSDSTND